MTKLRPGTVIEIPTRRGLAYAQYTHWNNLMGALIRILPGFHETRPHDFGGIAQQREVLVTFFPLEAAAREKMVELLGQEDVPAHARQFPLFRAEGPIEPRTGRVSSWWLWDGDREWRPEIFEPEHHRLPLREIIMPPLLISRLEEGWSPAQDSARRVREKSQASALGPKEKSAGVAQTPEPLTKHFLYFSQEDRAKKASNTLMARGYVVEFRPSTKGQWLLLVSSRDGRNPETARVDLERLATRLQAEYDGWEAVVDENG